MIVKRSTETGTTRSCSACQRKIKPGQWMVDFVTMNNETLYGRAQVSTHVTCLRKAIADVPDEDVQAFQKLRNAMVTSGKAFP